MDTQIITILTKIQKDITEVKRKLEEFEPVYGSGAWWSWSDRKALNDYKTGKYKTLFSKKEVKRYLNSIKS